MPPELAAELAAEAAEIPEGGDPGYSLDPRDYIWQKNPHRYILDEVGEDIWPYEALERIIREIVRSCADVKIKNASKVKSLEDFRVEQIMYYLVGKPLRPGPVEAAADHEILKRIAPELFKREMGLAESDFAELVKKVRPEIATWTPVKRQDYLNHLWGKFDAHMDEYLAKASWSDAPEQEQRRATTDQVIQLLRQLGYVRT
jgi:hypothetical protein